MGTISPNFHAFTGWYAEKGPVWSYALMLVCSAFSLLQAAVVFQDSFSVPAESNKNWVVAAETTTPLQFSDGKASLSNSSTIYSAFALHGVSPGSAAFTFSGLVSSICTGSGLFCCTDKSTGTLKGYAVLTSDNEVALYNYCDGAPVCLYTHPTKFVNVMENHLAISSNGERLSVFCNGYFQFSFPDTLGKPMDIAVIAAPQASVAFDDIEFSDTSSDSLIFRAITDSLKKLPAIWKILGSGAVAESANGLKVTTHINMVWHAGIPLPLENFTASIRLWQLAGSKKSAVGFYMGSQDTMAGDGLKQGVYCGVTFSGACTVYKQAGGEEIEMLEADSADVLQNDWNIMTVTRSHGVITLSVNDEETARISGVDSTGYGIELIVADSLSLLLSDFSMVCHPSSRVPVIAEEVHKKREAHVTVQGTVDLLGRRVKTPNYNTIASKRHAVPCVLVTERRLKIDGFESNYYRQRR